jgi:predicted NBD/HSP70 family sugar kinase
MYIAIDIGGTKTLVAVIDGKGKIIEEQKFPTPKSYDDFIKELSSTVAKLSTNEFRAFCVAAPGKLDRKHGIGIAFGNLPWEKVHIQEDLEHIVNAPGIIENDAKLAALAEAHALKKKYNKVLYVTISTGIGGGLIIDGIIDHDFEDIEIGQLLLEHNGRLKRWEDFASGRAIVEHFGKRASEITEKQDWYIISRNIAIGLIDIIATLTPDVIIIGGGVGTHLEKFKPQLDERLKAYDNPMINIPPIVQAQHPEEAVIYGCYQLIKQHYGKASK